MKLTYFGIYGRGEPIRMLLNHAGAKFTDNRIGMDEWPALKETGIAEFGQLPVFEWKDGTSMTQSVSILRALGIEYGYYPWGDMEKMWICDSSIDACYDVASAVVPIFFGPTDAVKADALKKFLESVWPTFLKKMDARLNGKQYFTGKLSIADFYIGAFLSQLVNPANPHTKLFEAEVVKHKNVVAFWNNFKNINAAHFKNRPAVFF